MEDKNPIQVAGRLFGALEYLVDHGSVSLAELAAALDLNKSTAHRIISSLLYMGYVRQDPDTGCYGPSFKVVDLAGRVMSRVDVNDIVRPFLQKLMRRCGETVHFVEREEENCIYIDKVEAPQNQVRMVSHVGGVLPFYRSAVGKALAARMTEDEVRRLWNLCRIERTTPYTITDLDEFMEVLEEVRRKGYALDNEENETGVRCIAAALDIRDDRTRYAFSISVPIMRMDNDRIRELSGYVKETQEEIAAAFR